MKPTLATALADAGWQVEMICYPDTADGPSWLWQEALAESRPEDYGLLVAIGNRPEPTVTADLVKRVNQWRSDGVSITILNRHEANWSRLPDLLKLWEKYGKNLHIFPSNIDNKWE